MLFQQKGCKDILLRDAKWEVFSMEIVVWKKKNERDGFQSLDFFFFKENLL